MARLCTPKGRSRFRFESPSTTRNAERPPANMLNIFKRYCVQEEGKWNKKNIKKIIKSCQIDKNNVLKNTEEKNNKKIKEEF